MRSFDYHSPALQEMPWPPVNADAVLSEPLRSFLDMSPQQQTIALEQRRNHPEEHSQFLHQSLATIYAYVLGYRDSPAYLISDEVLEGKLLLAKLSLERELVARWLPAPVLPHCSNQQEAGAYLRQFAETNAGVTHPLYDYLANSASRAAMEVFLLNEVVRNEVVDDEVALLVCGLQGLLKSVCATNLWDEVGRGKLKHFHTYWLRRLLGGPDSWARLMHYRSGQRPWFAGVTSNVFMMLLTRPACKLASYGHFLVTEGWVPPHFDKILAGMKRTGFTSEDEVIYFDAHVTIDPTHTDELIVGIEQQVPALSLRELRLILQGANMAVNGALVQYDRMLTYLQSIDQEERSKVVA